MSGETNVNILINSRKIAVSNLTLCMEREAGKHTVVSIKGIVQSESHDLLAESYSAADIQVSMDGNAGIIFCGLVTYMDIQVLKSEEAQYQELSLKAMSYTCLLDQTKEYAAFQKKSAAYQEVFDSVVSNYPDVGYFLDDRMQGMTVDSFVVQYEETDWEFMTRLASRLNRMLRAYDTTPRINFTVGIFWGADVYELSKEDEGQVDAVYDDGFYLQCQISAQDAPIFEVGDCISYQQRKYYVRKSEFRLENQTLWQYCQICGKEAFLAAEAENSFLTGLSLPGKVTKVKGNQLMISLDIDKMKETECWFPYSTFYSTFYCMPEKGDRINLYFPDFIEDHAFVLNSIGATTNAGRTDGTSGNGDASAGTNGKTGQGSAGTQNSQSEQIADISPYLSALVNTQYGKLIGIDATFGDNNSTDEASQGMSGSERGNSGASQGDSGRKGNTNANFDFSLLAQNPNIKVLCSKDGRMVILDDEYGSVSIVCDNGTYISLSDNGINIVTDEKIEFSATKDISLKADKAISLLADEEVTINCEGSQLSITPEKIKLFGNNIKINEE